MIDNRWFVAYEDEGPLGPCGPDSNTSPWRILYEYDNEKDAYNFYCWLKEFSRDSDLRRRTPRAVGYWSDDGGGRGRIKRGQIKEGLSFRS